jgi:hypothetical protein
VLKNKKIVLSSIAIIFALVVSSIFVNFTLAKSDSGTSTDGATSAAATTSLTGLSNIDLAVKNSNDTAKQKTGEDKFRIVQILPNSYSTSAEADTTLKATVTASGFSGKISNLDGYSDTTYLWKYVYAGEYFRLAVFNGYKTISDNMAEGAVELTTCTVSDLNSMNTTAQGILSQADFIYIWSNSASDYASTANDLSEDLYNWLDSYATADSHPIAICTGALCTDTPAGITGNNDTYRMGGLAYKLITKSGVARYDNVLVTASDFFKVLYEEAEDGITIPDMQETDYTLSDFILYAEKSGDDGGGDFLNFGTYYKWYDSITLVDFLNNNTDSTMVDSVYAPVGKPENKEVSTHTTREKTSWNFDNAKVLVISESSSSAMYDELKKINSSKSTSSNYVLNSKTNVWESVEKAPNSTLTENLYAPTRSRYIPSGADIYQITSSELVKAMDDGGKLENQSLSGSYFMDVATKTVSGTIKLGNEDIDLSDVQAYLLVETDSKVCLAGTSDTDNYVVDLVKSEVNKVDENGEDVLDEDGQHVKETVYTYEFKNLNPDYTYSVILAGVDTAYQVGISSTAGDVSSSQAQFDFYVKTEDDADVTGYDYRTEDDGDVQGNYLVLTDYDFLASVEAEGLDKTYTDDIVYDKLDLSTADKVKDYVDSLHSVYESNQEAVLQSGKTVIDLMDYDFIFIDEGNYSDEIGQTMYNNLIAAQKAGVFFIVSSKAGDGVGSGDKTDTGSTGSVIPIVNSPSAKAVADVINAGVYRTGSDNKFKVLEIQPDFPIDLDVAASEATVSTAYTTRSDGVTKITGNYYYVPSDVVSGKSKEELPVNNEYYQFDLTKAKIAYAVDGVSYGDIELTQVSTEKLIGMKDDIAATYDLVYIGGDISAMDRNPAEMFKGQHDLGNSTPGYTYQVITTFIMYYHTGTLSQLQSAGTYSPDTAPISYNSHMMAEPCVNGTYYTTTYLAENGNDITKTKYDELINYISSGRPVIVSDELSTVYDNMQGLNASGEKLSQAELLQGYWYNNGTLERKNYYLDPSSRMYTLLGNIAARKEGKNSYNVLWGFDSSDTQYISDADSVYGTSLYTMRNGTSYTDEKAQQQSWYENPSSSDTVLYNYKQVFSDLRSAEISKLISGSTTRARLTTITEPVTYSQGVESTYLKTNKLSYVFQVDGANKTYNYEIYVDKDKNTTFDSGEDYYTSGSVTSGSEKTVNLTLDSEFFGSASWLLRITDTDGNVVATKTGLAKIVNNNTTKSEINVLQVQTMAEGQNSASWSATDTLYFDIESQTAHKIAKYNVFANQTELDQSITTQYTALGLHENRFGIYEYDLSTGADDYYSNLADEISDDYDVNLDLVVASADRAQFTTGDNVASAYECLDTWVEEAETLKAGGKVDGHTQAEYSDLAQVALSEYANASAKVTQPKKALDKYLAGAIKYLNGEDTGTTYNYTTFINNFKTSTAETKTVLQYMQDTGDYYLIFWPKYNIMNHCASSFAQGKMSDDFGSDYATLYSAYVKVKDAEILAKDKYNTYLRRSYGANFMKNMYSILVLGPSDSFGGFKVDFKQKTCDYILDYVSNGGDLFFFHDSMTPYADAGAVNLTRTLLSVVGMNRFHVDITNGQVTYDKSITLGEYAVSTQDVSKADPNGKVHSDEAITTKNLDNAYYTPDITVFKVTEKAGFSASDSQYGTPYVYVTNYDVHTTSSGKADGVITFTGTLTEDTDIYYNINNDATKVTYTSSGSTYSDVTYNSPDSSLYYLTNYANNTSAGSGIINSINANLMMDNPSATWRLKGSSTKVYVSALAMTALYYNGNMGGATTTLPYVYAQENYKAATAWSQAANQDQSKCAETVKAEQLNKGLVTMYPYSISSSLNISGTHQQAYALDLESDNITVWYTLAGSNNASDAKQRSSKYAASPGDGMEAYFIYTTSYGNGAITYCGAGHSSVTGRGTKNNDERKLFINVIINSAAAVPEMPVIKLYEPTGTFDADDELAKDEEAVAESGKTIYQIDVDSKTDSPEFDMKITIPEKTKVTKVNVYYDLNYDDSDYSNRPVYEEKSADYDGDVMIKSYTSKGNEKLTDISGTITDLIRKGDTDKLKLQDEYFAPYGGNYTYIAVEVYYQGKTAPVFVMIKVKASDPLFDLTENTIDVPQTQDFVAEKKNIYA